MTPFQEFRYWARRASTRERMSATAAAAVVLALLAYVIAPVVRDSGGGAAQAGVGMSAASSGQPAATAPSGGSARTASETATTAARATAAGQAGTSSGGAGVSGGRTALAAARGGKGSAPPGRRGCVSPAGTDQGVTAATVKIAVIVVDVAGAANNTLFNTPSPDTQKQWFQYVIDAINASGGVACRKIVAQYFSANPLEQSSLQQTCLDVVDARPFFAMDIGAYFLYTALAQCYPQNHIPFTSSQLLPNAEKEKFYPYLFGQAIADTVYRNTVLALHQRGFFSAGKGFKKLGFIYRSCDDSVISTMRAAISQAGVGSGQLVPYDLGCPNGFASPADLSQAVLTFQQKGVTHVTMAEMGADFANFTNIAEQQGFKPKYGLAQDSVVPTTYSAAHGNFDNMANAIAISPDRFGEEHTPGYRPNASTRWCNKIFAAHNVTDTYHQPEFIGGGMCDLLQMFTVAVGHAPALARTALAAGLAAARSFDFAFTYGPARFTGPRPTTGGQFWRPLQFYKSCDCWRLLDRTFHPSF